MLDHTLEVSCAWCCEAFQRHHQRVITNCCSIAIGDSCVAESYDEHDACSFCTAPRCVEDTSSSSGPYDGPVHPRRFINLLDGPLISDKPTQDESHQQMNAEAMQAYQARKQIIEALDVFMDVWKMEAEKLEYEDRQWIIIRAHNALSDGFAKHPLPALTTRPTPPTSRPSTPQPQSSPEPRDLTSTSSPTTVTTASATATTMAISSTTISDVDYISRASASLNTISVKYAGDLCDDCKPLKRRLATALEPGPHMFEWQRDSCRRCRDVGKAVKDAAGLPR